ncbi:MAG: ATP synthase subunit I [Oscillospiraceae bacterium]|nr:ATP synthase subunit I [Oscillospiraceae bacterium]
MKLQPASQREVKRIAVGTLVCDVLMVAGLFLASQFDIGTFDLGKILLSAAIGSVIAVLNFALMCLTVQSAVGMADQKQMKAKFQLSYNVRMIIQAGWTVAAFLIPGIHFVAGAAPVIFPKVTILYLQAKGKLLPPDPPRPSNPESTEEPQASSDENL